MINWKKILFKLHIRNTYPTTMVLGGHEIPANIIRTDEVSSNIRPAIKILPTEENMKTRYYRVGTDPNKTNTLYLANGVDPIQRVDLDKVIDKDYQFQDPQPIQPWTPRGKK